MLKRARFSLLVALTVATLGFNGIIASSVAQTLFYLSLAFAFLSFIFGMFEVDRPKSSRANPAAIDTRGPRTSQPLRVAP